MGKNDSYYQDGKWWTYGDRDNPFTYVYRLVTYHVQMWPRIKVYGLRYLYDRHYRVTVRRKQRGGTQLIKHQKKILYTMCSGLCGGCKLWFSMRDLTLDHLLHYSHPDYKRVKNMQLLCDPCHKLKDSTPPRKRFWGVV